MMSRLHSTIQVSVLDVLVSHLFLNHHQDLNKSLQSGSMDGETR